MVSQLYDVDAEQLIELVKNRPVLWNRKHEKYRDKFKTQKAWQEILTELDVNFEEFDDDVKSEFGRIVLKKWTQMRDSYRKSLSKKQRSGPAGSKIKTYIYSSRLRFLDNMFEERERANRDTSPENIEDPVSANEQSENDEIHQESVPDVSNLSRPEPSGSGKKDGLPENKFKKPVPKKQKTNADEWDVNAASAVTPNRHLHFFKGLLPSLEEFDEFDTLDFQMEVLKLVKDIRMRKHPVYSAAVRSTQSLNSRHQQQLLHNTITTTTPQQQGDSQFYPSSGRFSSQPNSVYTSPSASNDSSEFSLLCYKEECE
ncbi:uncharacterized protein LOC123317115 [Coccinella septempunctata]|uniref:uncharacterized protein LOC123317115 n=1 Tax=Coccinella septempunctata TaxID=41139 RepID=UPI001D0911EA|nr:uncharacterized protein LOC123317115 [Coccinella septempunctata]